MHDLLAEYRETLRLVRRLWARAGSPADRQIIAGMIRDLEWTIAYMTLGAPPPVEDYSPRERRRRRVVPVDPALLEAVVATRDAMVARAERAGIILHRPERAALEAALQGLTEAERDVYVLIVGEGLSQRAVAGLTGRSLRQVRRLYEAAVRRVALNVRNLQAQADQCGAI